MNPDCIFCKIINKEAPADIVYEDGHVLAIKTIAPVAPGHTLVIPKVHAENIFDISHESLEELMVVAKNLAVTLKDEYQATGVNLVHSAGKDAEQSVFHFHLHIIPRSPDDGLRLFHETSN